LGIHQLPDKLADLQTAGIAIGHGFNLLIGDFQGLGLDLIDPWPATNDGERCGNHRFRSTPPPSASSVAQSARKGYIDLGTISTRLSPMCPV
jgi:hypothetical protein